MDTRRCRHGAALAGKGRDTDERRSRPVVEVAELRDERDAGHGGFVAEAIDRLEQALRSFQIDASVNEPQHCFVSFFVLGFERVEMSCDRLAQADTAGGVEPATFAVDHALELVTASQFG